MAQYQATDEDKTLCACNKNFGRCLISVTKCYSIVKLHSRTVYPVKTQFPLVPTNYEQQPYKLQNCGTLNEIVLSKVYVHKQCGLITIALYVIFRLSAGAFRVFTHQHLLYTQKQTPITADS